jgi:hypothetical protein
VANSSVFNSAARQLFTEEGLFVRNQLWSGDLGRLELAGRPENTGKLIVAILPDLGSMGKLGAPYLPAVALAWVCRSAVPCQQPRLKLSFNAASRLPL